MFGYQTRVVRPARDEDFLLIGLESSDVQLAGMAIVGYQSPKNLS